MRRGGTALLLLLLSTPVRSDEVLHPERQLCFVESYPGIVCGFEGNDLRLCSGAILPWNDGRLDKTHDDKLSQPDLEDTVSQAYPRGPLPGPLPAEFEPGRMRNQAFLDAVYGASPKDVRSRLRAIPWPGAGQKLRVTQIAGVAEHLQTVSRAVAALPASVRRAMARIGGSYNHRVIAGTTRNSAHAYGIAVDVAMDRAEYWRWRFKAGVLRPMRGGVPPQVVEIFEQQGFIWGGKWYHYDTMHFEYRPELLHPVCSGELSNVSSVLISK